MPQAEGPFRTADGVTPTPNQLFASVRASTWTLDPVRTKLLLSRLDFLPMWTAWKMSISVANFATAHPLQLPAHSLA